MRVCSKLADALEPRLQVERFEQLLLLAGLHVHEAGDQVGERRRRFHRLHGIGQFGRRLRQQANGFGGQPLQIERARFDVTADMGSIGQVFDARDHERQTVLQIEHAEASLALHDQVMSAVGAVT